MKKELKELKDLYKRYASVKNDYEKEREIFELCSSLAIKDVSFLELSDEVESFYEIAHLFYGKFHFVVSLAEELKISHPKYGEKRFKNTLIEKVISSQKWNYEDEYEKANYVVETHLIYESLGFKDLLKLEIEMTTLAKEIDEKTKSISDQTKGAVKKVGEGILSVIRPYGEVAKGQLSTLEEKTKKAVNNGTKKLIKSLEEVADKTESGK